MLLIIRDLTPLHQYFLDTIILMCWTLSTWLECRNIQSKVCSLWQGLKVITIAKLLKTLFKNLLNLNKSNIKNQMNCFLKTRWQLINGFQIKKTIKDFLIYKEKSQFFKRNLQIMTAYFKPCKTYLSAKKTCLKAKKNLKIYLEKRLNEIYNGHLRIKTSKSI